MKNLGARIRKAREAKKISQSQLANMCGTSSAAIVSNWELDHNEPSCDTLVKIASFLEVSLDYLLDYQDTHKEKIIDPETKKLIADIDELGPDFFKMIRTLTNDEIKRRENIRISYASNKPTFQMQLPLFIDETDQHYALNKQETKKLIKQKAQRKMSDWDITEFLWAAGYSENLSYNDVVGIFAKAKIPSSQLLYHLQCFFYGSYSIFIPDKLGNNELEGRKK